MDRFIENHFDSSHNTFESVRRIADIYEWGNNVLWPGFFADMGPCNEIVGARRDQGFVKGCNDDAWPDGDGPFGLDGATPFGIEELVRRMDQLDWTEGVLIRQSRSAPQMCAGVHQLGQCYPELEYGGHKGATATFGHNKTHPEEEPEFVWKHYTTEQLGGNPEGIKSAAIPSMKLYEVEGYVAAVIPFFSERYLPEQVRARACSSVRMLERAHLVHVPPADPCRSERAPRGPSSATWPPPSTSRTSARTT